MGKQIWKQGVTSSEQAVYQGLTLLMVPSLRACARQKKKNTDMPFQETLRTRCQYFFTLPLRLILCHNTSTLNMTKPYWLPIDCYAGSFYTGTQSRKNYQKSSSREKGEHCISFFEILSLFFFFFCHQPAISKPCKVLSVRNYSSGRRKPSPLPYSNLTSRALLEKQ